MRLIYFFLLILFTQSIIAQDITGEWNNIDEETGKVNSVIKIYKKGNLYYGKIIDITDPLKRENLCTECKGKYKDTPILGIEMLTDLMKDEDRYSGGKILDPKTGKEYRAEIWVDEDDNNKLNVRGYIAFFYETRTWIRKQ